MTKTLDIIRNLRYYFVTVMLPFLYAICFGMSREDMIMKLKRIVVSVLLLTLLLSVFLSLGATAMADEAPQEAALAYNAPEAETIEESSSDGVGLWLVIGGTLLMALFGVMSVNCQKIYDSEK